MPDLLILSLADRFALLIEAVCRAVAASAARDRTEGPFISLIWGRLRRMAARFARLAAPARADIVGGAIVSKRAACGGTAPRASRPRPPAPRLPDEFAWLLRRAPGAAAYGSQLQHLLSMPEMTALLAARPELGRVLRPLCRMLGVTPDPDVRPLLALPARPRAAAAALPKAGQRTGPVRARRRPRGPGLRFPRRLYAAPA